MFCINHWLEKKSDSAIPSQDSYETIFSGDYSDCYNEIMNWIDFSTKYNFDLRKIIGYNIEGVASE